MASSDSATGFIKRNRPPRVQISYADPIESNKQVELPFVMGVFSDLSGNASKVEKPAFNDREQGGKLSVNLNFKKMADLSPGEIARQVPALSQLLEARQQLANLQRYMNGKTGAQDQLKALLSDPKLMAALEERRAKTTDGKSEE